ncbi:mannosyl-oligosaccharide glucosidase-like [Octopus sinensis]|uniref:Mannosyl-oligosaccharide glucosidase n=1 Tax=Octopus sinensis TaxID=2607531 RepID=A0A7E6EN26_9MOLL|nr:mannosyl-oligosaccharide glucosidase-like [Octopus sinensis]
MWFRQISSPHQPLKIRHWCEPHDSLNFGWHVHDGRNCGVQSINETDFSIETTFVKSTESVIGSKVRISFKQGTFRGGISIITYLYHSDGQMVHIPQRDGLTLINGHTSALGKFTVGIKSDCTLCTTNRVTRYVSDPVQIEHGVRGEFYWTQNYLNPSKSYAALNPQNRHTGNHNMIAVQTTSFSSTDFSIDVDFESVGAPPVDYHSQLSRCLSDFDKKFARTFSTSALSSEKVKFSKFAVSSLLGGISHFRGRSVVGKMGSPGNVSYFKASLITAVPSRAFFPRGFLWDEGFHGILLARWDPDRSMEIMAHWLDLMNAEGWIPREQILGTESTARVPHEFIRQQVNDGNPPTFFLALECLIGQESHQETIKSFLRVIFPRLKTWLSWYMRTQGGVEKNSFRWHGRGVSRSKTLRNPLTLMSGLDDYPRASNPTELERHVDLYCWMAYSSRTMLNIARLLGDVSAVEKYGQMYDTLSDVKLLNELHWSPEKGRYADYGLHSAVSMLSEYQFIDEGFGYVNIFPFLVTILSPGVELNHILEDIQTHLLCPFGLRSLSKDSLFYREYNSEDDPPYWRGDIWVNMNYLALRALSHYMRRLGENDSARVVAGNIYNTLRDGLIENVYKEYVRTGFIWERYDDQTGRGKGVHPFTGWSSLVVLIMTEDYH